MTSNLYFCVMKLLNNIKSKLGKRKLEKMLEKQKRKIQVSNFNNAKSVGIIYNIKDAEFQDTINKYVDYLREEVGFKTIVALGFNPKKGYPHFLKIGIKYKSFSKLDLDWMNLPKSVEVNNFCEENFDFLIDLSNNNNVSLRYILVNSQAKLKIGRYSKRNEKFYDFMVDTTENTTVKDYIKQVNHFLNNVKPK